MGTMKNGIAWNGAYINGNRLNGAIVDSKKFFEYPHFLLEYTDTSDISFSKIFSNENDLKNFIYDNCRNFKTIKLSSKGNIKIKNCNKLFYFCINTISIDLSEFDTSDTTSMSGMFRNTFALTLLNLSNIITDKVIDMSSMFESCSMKYLDLTNFNTSNVEKMYNMFYAADIIELDLTNFDMSKVKSVSDMFNVCVYLTKIYCNKDWNTLNITSSSRLFKSCKRLVGATYYKDDKVGIEMANPDTGYFTRK